MRFGTKFRQGDILIVPFPFTNLNSVKQRPVLVLSKNNYNRNSEDLIVCGITSNLREENNSILINNDSLIDGFLPRSSLVKVDKLFSVHKSLIKKRIGIVSDEIFSEVRRKFLDLV